MVVKYNSLTGYIESWIFHASDSYNVKFRREMFTVGTQKKNIQIVFFLNEA